MPRSGSQYGIVGSSRISDGNFLTIKSYFSLPFDKEAVDLGCVAAFKTPQLLRQHTIERISDHGHDDVKMYLDQYGRGKGIEVEELDSLRDNVFHPPPSGIISHEQFQGGCEIIGDEEGGFFMAIASNNHLAQLTVVVRQCDEGFVDHGIGVFPFAMGNMDTLPGVKLVDLIHHVFAPASEGDEPNPLPIELGELGVGCEPGVKDKGGLDPSSELLPE